MGCNEGKAARAQEGETIGLRNPPLHFVTQNEGLDERRGGVRAVGLPAQPQDAVAMLQKQGVVLGNHAYARLDYVWPECDDIFNDVHADAGSVEAGCHHGKLDFIHKGCAGAALKLGGGKCDAAQQQHQGGSTEADHVAAMNEQQQSRSARTVKRFCTKSFLRLTTWDEALAGQSVRENGSRAWARAAAAAARPARPLDEPPHAGCNFCKF